MKPKTFDGWSIEPLRPHVLRIRWVGPYTNATSAGVSAYVEEYRAELGGDAGIWVVIEIAEDASLEKSARKTLLEAGKKQPFRGTAFIGGPKRLRVVAELIANAVSLIVKNASPVKFVDNEEEALAWLEEQMKLEHGQ